MYHVQIVEKELGFLMYLLMKLLIFGQSSFQTPTRSRWIDINKMGDFFKALSHLQLTLEKG